MSVSSPCINVCQMNADTGYCEGCLRTLDEIAAWTTYDDETRGWVLEALESRRAEMLTRGSRRVAGART